MAFNRKTGFTLVELILVIAIVGTLSTVAVPQFYDLQEEALYSAESSEVANINAGLSVYGVESMATGRSPLYPSLLDPALPGDASVANPFFSSVLIHSITNRWEKVDQYRYRGPTGTEYRYDPLEGKFFTESNPYAMYGNIIGKTSMLLAFDSGTLISLNSDLAYIPGIESGMVRAVLGSGITINTDGSGGATVTLLDGTEIYIENIVNEDTRVINESSWSADRMENSSEYLYVGNERAVEGNYVTTYYQRDSNFDPATNTRTYNYEYDTAGSSSQVGLSTENGYIWETEYSSNSPSSYTHSYTRSDDGSYKGTYEISYDWDMFSNYGRSDKENGFGYTADSQDRGTTSNTYSYDNENGVYVSSSEGSAAYNYQYEYLDGRTYEVGDSYNYSSEYTYNRRTGSYAGRGKYKGERQNYSYVYSYDPSTGEYIYTYTDNNSGRIYTYTN